MDLSRHQNTTPLPEQTAVMDALRTEVEQLSRTATLDQSIDDVEKVLEQLLQAREKIAAGEDPLESVCPSAPRLTLIRLHDSFDYAR